MKTLAMMKVSVICALILISLTFAITGAAQTSDKTIASRTRVVDGLQFHYLTAGKGPAVVLIHGYAETSRMWRPLFPLLAERFTVIAPDLPGIGDSAIPENGLDMKKSGARVHALVKALGIDKARVVGHDIGLMVAYAYAAQFPAETEKLVVMDAFLPGVAGWEDVYNNPQIWHFAFHSVPDLPEKLVSGHVASYFDFFYDRLAGPPGVSPQARQQYVQAYARPLALHTGFEWYRAFAQDERDNRGVEGTAVCTPVLYLRGDHEAGDIKEYANGLHKAGLLDVECRIVATSGHFAPDEQPEAVAASLRGFITHDALPPAVQVLT